MIFILSNFLAWFLRSRVGLLKENYECQDLTTLISTVWNNFTKTVFISNHENTYRYGIYAESSKKRMDRNHWYNLICFSMVK